MDQDRSSARRLAVQLHNRKHPIPPGVYALLALIVVVVGTTIWMANQEPSQEIQQLRDGITDDIKRSKEFQERSDREMREAKEKADRDYEAALDSIVEESQQYREERFQKSKLTLCDRCAGEGKIVVESRIVKCPQCRGTGDR